MRLWFHAQRPCCRRDDARCRPWHSFTEFRNSLLFSCRTCMNFWYICFFFGANKFAQQPQSTLATLEVSIQAIRWVATWGLASWSTHRPTIPETRSWWRVRRGPCPHCTLLILFAWRWVCEKIHSLIGLTPWKVVGFLLWHLPTPLAEESCWGNNRRTASQCTPSMSHSSQGACADSYQPAILLALRNAWTVHPHHS